MAIRIEGTYIFFCVKTLFTIVLLKLRGRGGGIIFGSISFKGGGVGLTMSSHGGIYFSLTLYQ